MKVAVTATGPDLASEVDSRFGRAKCFLVVDTDTGECVAHDNAQNLNAAQGAGVQAGQTVSKLGVDAVVTGNVGPKAFAVLQAGGIKVYTGAAGTAGAALEQLKTGQLKCVAGANVDGHWS
jgi:predicted Fe-Mo cluster-binding NifX family protein